MIKIILKHKHTFCKVNKFSNEAGHASFNYKKKNTIFYEFLLKNIVVSVKLNYIQ